jgi:hypothetical protein
MKLSEHEFSFFPKANTKETTEFELFDYQEVNKINWELFLYLDQDLIPTLDY